MNLTESSNQNIVKQQFRRRNDRYLDPIVEETNQHPDDVFQACRLGNLDLVKRLINKDNCNDKRETTGRRSSCLHFAAGFGRRDVCLYLLDECQADPSIKDEG